MICAYLLLNLKGGGWLEFEGWSLGNHLKRKNHCMFEYDGFLNLVVSYVIMEINMGCFRNHLKYNKSSWVRAVEYLV